MVKPWQILRAKSKKKKPNLAEQLADNSGTNVETTKSHKMDIIPDHLYSNLLPLMSRPKEPPPRLELPVDLRSSPFSKVTYSPPPMEGPKLRRVPAMSDMSTNAFRLLDLPAELRLTILKDYFGKRTMAVSLDDTNPPQKRFFSLAHKRRKQNIIAVFQTCKRLRDEALDVLWDSTTFVIRITGKLHWGIVPRPAIPMHRMRHVVLNVGFIPMESMPELHEALSRFRDLNTADVHFDFTDPRFVPMRTGDRIIETFLEALKTERLRRVSCVSHLRDEDMWLPRSYMKEMRNVLPYSSPAYEGLKEKFNAYDVSLDECGKVMPKLTNGVMGEWDTGILDAPRASS